MNKSLQISNALHVLIEYSKWLNLSIVEVIFIINTHTSYILLTRCEVLGELLRCGDGMSNVECVPNVIAPPTYVHVSQIDLTCSLPKVVKTQNEGEHQNAPNIILLSFLKKKKIEFIEMFQLEFVNHAIRKSSNRLPVKKKMRIGSSSRTTVDFAQWQSSLCTLGSLKRQRRRRQRGFKRRWCGDVDGVRFKFAPRRPRDLSQAAHISLMRARHFSIGVFADFPSFARSFHFASTHTHIHIHGYAKNRRPGGGKRALRVNNVRESCRALEIQTHTHMKHAQSLREKPQE